MYIDLKTMRRVSMANPDVTNRYFRDMRRVKVLSPEEQLELLKEYASSKDEKRKLEIRDKILLANQAFIVSMARHLATEDDFNDLISEGNLGMADAIRTFDVEMDNKFLTYASYYVKKKMKEYQMNKKMVKPKNLVSVYTFSESEKNKYFAEHGHYPTPEELTEILNDKGRWIANKEDTYDISFTSIDAGFSDEDNDVTSTDWFDKACYTRDDCEFDTCSTSSHVEHINTRQMVERSLSVLNEHEREIVCRYYGIGYPQRNPSEVAYEMGLKCGGDGIKRRVKRYIKKIKNHGKIDTYIQ